MCTRTPAVGGTNTTTGAGTAFRTAPRHSPSITTRHLASRATSAPHRRLGAHGAGAVVSAAWTVIVVVAVSAVEVSSTVGGAVCLAVVVGIAGVVVLVVEGVGVVVGSVDFVVASVVGDDAGFGISKILTVEYPVEYQLKGVNQIPVRPKIGLSFAAGLRHIVRCGMGSWRGPASECGRLCHDTALHGRAIRCPKGDRSRPGPEWPHRRVHGAGRLWAPAARSTTPPS